MPLLEAVAVVFALLERVGSASTEEGAAGPLGALGLGTGNLESTGWPVPRVAHVGEVGTEGGELGLENEVAPRGDKGLAAWPGRHRVDVFAFHSGDWSCGLD